MSVVRRTSNFYNIFCHRGDKQDDTICQERLVKAVQIDGIEYVDFIVVFAKRPSSLICIPLSLAQRHFRQGKQWTRGRDYGVCNKMNPSMTMLSGRLSFLTVNSFDPSRKVARRVSSQFCVL